MPHMTMRKQGILARIDAVSIQCPDCGSLCENESGSTLIEEGDTLVTCSSCRGQYTVPASAFQVQARKARTITSFDAAVEEARAKMSGARRHTPYAVVSFTGTRGTRFRVYPLHLASQSALRDCQAGEATRIEAKVQAPDGSVYPIEYPQEA
jgi:DNA gyrase/topoisomerase IV subunit A